TARKRVRAVAIRSSTAVERSRARWSASQSPPTTRAAATRHPARIQTIKPGTLEPEDCERRSGQDGGRREQLERGLRGRGQRRARQRVPAPVGQLDLAGDVPHLTTKPPHLRREAALGERERERPGRSEHGLDPKPLRAGDVRREYGKRTPRKREPQVRVKTSA